MGSKCSATANCSAHCRCSSAGQSNPNEESASGDPDQRKVLGDTGGERSFLHLPGLCLLCSFGYWPRSICGRLHVFCWFQLGVACGCVTCANSKETTDAPSSHVR